jgi:HPt (histidine-containing phosphotransfer) domain-containing protein
MDRDPVTRALVELYLKPLGYTLDWVAAPEDWGREQNGAVAFLLGANALPDLEPASLLALARRLGDVPLLGMAGDARRFPPDAVPRPLRCVLRKPLRAEDLLAALAALQAPLRAAAQADTPLAGLEAMAREMEMDAGMIADLGQSFLQRGEQYLLELAAAAEPRDDERLNRIAHGFKGMAGNLRFRRLTELAEELRRAAKEHAGNPAALSRMLQAEFEGLRLLLEERWQLARRTDAQG